MMIDKQLIAELEGYDPDTDSIVTWKFSTHGYDAGGVDGFYHPSIENPCRLSRSVSGFDGGRINLSYGEMTLTNFGELDDMANHFFDGRILKLSVVRTADSRATAVEIMNAQVEDVVVESNSVSVRLRDRAVTLDKPFSGEKYLGTNELPLGIEGTDDIKDQAKPIIYGRIALMSPVCVNTSKLVYQVSNTRCHIINVFDAGVYLTRNDDPYTSVEAMMEDEPEPGTYRLYPALGLFRLGAIPFGTLSVSVADSFEPQRISAAGILKRVLRDFWSNRSNNGDYDTTIPQDGWDWHWKDLALLDQKNAGSLGLIVNPDEVVSSIIDRICQSVGAFWGFDAFGKMKVFRLDAPSGNHVAIFNDENILTLERNPELRKPYQSVTLHSDTNYVVQERSSLAGSVTEARANWLKLASRDQTYTDDTIKSKRLLSEAETYDTLLNSTAIAQAEAKRRVDLLTERRDYISMTVANPLSYINTVDLGEVIKVETNRYGYDAGKLFTVIGVDFDFEQNTFDIQAFG